MARSRDSGPGKPVRPELPRPAARAAAGVFGALSRLRGARIAHPVGTGFAGRLTVDRPERPDPSVPLFDRPGEHPALFRLSRAVGLPEPLPDLLGFSFRLTDVHGPGRHQDFLLVSSIGAPLLHHLLVPGRKGFGERSFSSLLPYRLGEQLRVVEVAARGEARFDLKLAPLGGRAARVGELRLGERLPDEESERLAFNPWNTGGGIRPVGPLMGLRRAAYRGSQLGRGLPPPEVP